MTNKRLDDLDILDAELAGEDKETCDSAKTLISDQLQESARGTSQLDGHLTEGEEPIEKKEKLETEVTEQVDEAKTEEEEEADEHNKTASENAPHEKISDKSRSTSEDVSEEEVKEGTMENNEEISEKKLADGYQHNKIEDVHKTVFTTLLTKEVGFSNTKYYKLFINQDVYYISIFSLTNLCQ